MSTINFFTTYIAGKWFAQNNIYLLNTKKRASYLRELNIIITKTHGENSISSQKTNNIAMNINNISLSKALKFYTTNNSNRTTPTTFKQIDNNLIKVNYATINNKYYYEEYMYLVNRNLIFSIGILKNKYKYSYSGVIITSYIKLNK